MAKYWFKTKKLGWGITPISPEGWLITAIFIAVLVIDAYATFRIYPWGYALVRYLLNALLYSFVFILLVKRKTKGDLGI